MEMKRVVSDGIAAVGYDEDQQRLFIRFKYRRQVYEFCNVPRSLYEQLMSAPSMGRFYRWNIRGKYPCPKLLRSKRHHGNLNDW